MNTLDEIRPQVLARELEARGFGSLFIGEHSHIPVARATRYPPRGTLPDLYRRMMDPFVSLAVAAAGTNQLELGLGVCLVLEHDVLQLAKAVATLDQLSGGRVVFGVGTGWNVEELANHRLDIPWRKRYRAVEECVTALRRCWADEQSEFHGEHFELDPLWCLPKPAQQPHPPVLFGGIGPVGRQHALRWADGWAPIDMDPARMADRISRFRNAAEDLGRDV